MKEYPMRREGSHLVPIDAIAAEEIAEIAAGETLMVSIKRRRNPQQHRLAWALADKVAQACDWLHDRDDAMDYLKMKAHHVRVLVDPKTNKTYLLPRSIAFASAPQAVFNRFFNRMVFIVCSEILPGVSEDTLRREIEQMVGAQ